MAGALAARATLVSARDRPVLAPDLAGTVAHAGFDPTLVGRALQDAVLCEIAADFPIDSANSVLEFT
jgi:hypothetical protein